MKQLIFDFSRAPRPTLANFSPGRNSEALATLHAWLTGLLKERCIYLWGARGCGKTHLLQAAVDAAQSAGRSAMYAGAGSLDLVGDAHALPALIAIDDAGRLSATAQGALFRLLQRLREEEGQLLVAGELAPAGLELRGDLRTRLSAGLVFQVHLLTDEEKAEALHSHAAARGFALAPEILEYLLRHRGRDLPSLMAILDAVDQYSLQTKRPVTLPLLGEVLQLSAASRPADI